ncbi:curli-like amyloid fiber formation chaperone CsgH [Hoeflea sp.]|uniref:curli-like amyloid fiber formation chaperone CsgH n=1 Tax=Hoeflea sp. TaxID=1940281 RepID=UPI003A91B0F8
MLRIVPSALGLFAAMSSMVMADPGQSATPEIDIAPLAGGYNIVGRLVGLSDATVSSTLAIEKNGPSGSITTRQSREVKLAVGEVFTIAKTNLSASQDSVVKITLEIFRDELPVGSTIVTIGPQEK